MVEALVPRAQALQDPLRPVRVGFFHIDVLEAAHQRLVLREAFLVLLIGRAADETDVVVRHVRLENVRGVERPAADRACADDVVDLVEVDDGLLLFGNAL